MSRSMNARIVLFAVFSLASLVALGWSGALFPAQAEDHALPAVFDIDYPGKKAAVTFPHEAHFELAECTDCHHTSEGLTAATMAEVTVQKCGACHTEPEDGVPDVASMSPKKNAFHLNCITCHKDAAKADKALSPPTKCNDCHPKD